MTKIYAVSRGCYSDYRVVALFSTESDAKLFMERHPDRFNEWNDVEVYELDSNVEKLREGFSYFFVHMRRDGSATADVSSTFINGMPCAAFGGDPSRPESQSFTWYGWARDAAHAVKIANEHRLMLIAQEVGK